MKNIRTLLTYLSLLSAICCSCFAQTHVLNLSAEPKQMTVQDVIKLSKAGFSDDLIIDQIRKTGQHFNLSTDQLLQLKQASVSEKVIEFMIDPTSAAAASQPGPSKAAVPPPSSSAPEPSRTADSSVPGLPTEIGAYAKQKGKWVEILPEVVNWKTGGVMKSVATVGVVKGDVNGHVNGSSSKNHVSSPVEFMIVAREGDAITEYQLVKLHEHGSSREFRTVTGGVFHVSGGATRDLMAFDGTKVASRTYSVKFSGSAGEYGFIPPGAFTSMNTASAGKIYSFRVVE
jgi:hypothetical protein